jgi:hypothetical protein
VGHVAKMYRAIFICTICLKIMKYIQCMLNDVIFIFFYTIKPLSKFAISQPIKSGKTFFLDFGS